MRLHLEITGKCNLSCVHCYNKKYNNKEIIEQELSHKKWLKIIREANQLDCKRFTISGGEPLMYADARFEFLTELIRECKAPVILLTNGHLLTSVRLQELERLNNLLAIRLSLDGLRSHNRFRIGSDYREILQKIRIIRETTNLKVAVVTMLNKRNMGELVGLYRELKSLKIDRWNIDIPFYAGNYREGIKGFGQRNFKEIIRKIGELIKIYIGDNKPFQIGIVNIYKSELAVVPYESFDFNSHPCSYSDIVCVKPNGDINVCAALDLRLSNIKEDGSLNSAVEHARVHPFYAIKIKDITQCQNCRYIKVCGSGCRADAKYFTGL